MPEYSAYQPCKSNMGVMSSLELESLAAHEVEKLVSTSLVGLGGRSAQLFESCVYCTIGHDVYMAVGGTQN